MLIVRIGGVFFLDSITRATSSKAYKRITFSSFYLFRIKIARIRATALNYKIWNIAMELQVVIKALFSQLNKVSYVNRSIFTHQLNANIALRRFYYGNFIAIGLIFGYVHSHSVPLTAITIIDPQSLQL